MNKFVFIFAIAAATLVGCSEDGTIIPPPDPGVIPPPDPSKGYSPNRVSSFSAVVSDSTLESTKIPIDSLIDEKQSDF